MPMPRWKTLGLPKPPAKVYREVHLAKVLGGNRPKPVRKGRPKPMRIIGKKG